MCLPLFFIPSSCQFHTPNAASSLIQFIQLPITSIFYSFQKHPFEAAFFIKLQTQLPIKKQIQETKFTFFIRLPLSSVLTRFHLRKNYRSIYPRACIIPGNITSFQYHLINPTCNLNHHFLLPKNSNKIIHQI